MTGGKRQASPHEIGLVFRGRFGEQFDEPCTTARRIKANGGKFFFRVAGLAWLHDLAPEMGFPVGRDKSFRNRPSLFHGREMRRQNAINILGTHAEGFIATKQPIARCQTADDDHVRMDVSRNRGGYFGQHFPW
jgi:hypothetical protein